MSDRVEQYHSFPLSKWEYMQLMIGYTPIQENRSEKNLNVVQNYLKEALEIIKENKSEFERRWDEWFN